MSFLDFFRRRTEDVFYIRVLVCSLDPAFESELIADFEIYRQHFESVKLHRFKDPNELLNSLADRYDIVHVLAAVTLDGYLGEGQITGTELIEKSASWGTKLLWLASSNDPQGYIKGFKPKGKKLNLVMTIDRGEYRFSRFLEKLLSEMQSGSSMPVAWNRIAPQIPGQQHPDVPGTIFYCGLGQVRFV
jgi:hypothetical protein